MASRPSRTPTSERHLLLLQDIGRLVASTVDQRRLGAQAQRASEVTAIRVARLELLNEIAEELSACLDEDQAHQALLAGVRRLVPDAPRASVVRFDDTLARFRVVAFAGVDAVPTGWQPVRGASFEHLIATGTPVDLGGPGQSSGYSRPPAAQPGRREAHAVHPDEHERPDRRGGQPRAARLPPDEAEVLERAAHPRQARRGHAGPAGRAGGGGGRARAR